MSTKNVNASSEFWAYGQKRLNSQDSEKDSLESLIGVYDQQYDRINPRAFLDHSEVLGSIGNNSSAFALLSIQGYFNAVQWEPLGPLGNSAYLLITPQALLQMSVLAVKLVLLIRNIEHIRGFALGVRSHCYALGIVCMMDLWKIEFPSSLLISCNSKPPQAIRSMGFQTSRSNPLPVTSAWAVSSVEEWG